MTDRKLSELTTLTTITNTGSYFPLVDIDEVAEVDQNKTITFANMLIDISTAITPTLDRVRVTSNDTTANFLFNKITAGTDISVTEINDGGDESIEIAFTGVAGGGGEDYFVDNATLATPLATGSESIAIGPASNAAANDCIQFMSGTNNTATTMQFRSTPIANDNSVLTGHTAVNYTPTAANEIDDHLSAIDTAIGTFFVTPTTTKGDIIVHDGTSDVRLPVGSNGQKLTANSVPTEGLEWVDEFPQIVAEVDSSVTTSITANNLELIPIDVLTAAVDVAPPLTPAPGHTFAVVDSRGFASVNNIVVEFDTAGSVNFHGQSLDDTISTAFAYRRYTYINATVGWVNS